MKKNNNIAYFFIIPAIIFFAIFTVWPLIKLFQLSLFKTNFIKTQFIWFANFIKIMSDDTFKSAIFNSFIYVIIIVPSRICLALLISLLVYDLDKKMHNLVRFIFYVPVFASGIIISNVYKWIFNPTSKGLVNQFLNSLGMENIIFFSTRLSSTVPIAIIMITSTLGFDIIVYMAVMLSIKKEQIEAAKIDGCNWWQIKTMIILPQLAPVIMLTSLLAIIGIFQIFEYIFMLAPYDYAHSVMYDIYYTGFIQNSNGMAAAKSIVFIAIIFVVSYVKRKIESKRKE